MTLALTIGQPDHLDVNERPLSLQRRVHRAIASHTEFSLDRIVTQDNRVKYTNAGRPKSSADHLDEVFRLMRELNEAGVGSHALGRLSETGSSFRRALEDICAKVAETFSGKPLIYVELGPEPVKTGFIVKTLLELGGSRLTATSPSTSIRCRAPICARLLRKFCPTRRWNSSPRLSMPSD
ncbi:hypothetical protein QW131_24075 [Roseibium salinum]|nr:hypothetical protein [Roseibium salinum]